MRYWYHSESEALWSTKGSNHFHSDPTHMEGEAGMIAELSDSEFEAKLEELKLSRNDIMCTEGYSTEPVSNPCYRCGEEH